nr:protein yeiS [Salmonella sp. NCTC 7297]
MDVQTIFVALAFLLLPLFCFREAWKGWRTGAVDKIVKNTREPVYVYRHADPVPYWSYLFLYTGCGFFIYWNDYLSSFLSLIYLLPL